MRLAYEFNVWGLFTHDPVCGVHSKIQWRMNTMFGSLIEWSRGVQCMNTMFGSLSKIYMFLPECAKLLMANTALVGGRERKGSTPWE